MQRPCELWKCRVCDVRAPHLRAAHHQPRCRHRGDANCHPMFVNPFPGCDCPPGQQQGPAPVPWEDANRSLSPSPGLTASVPASQIVRRRSPSIRNPRRNPEAIAPRPPPIVAPGASQATGIDRGSSSSSLLAPSRAPAHQQAPQSVNIINTNTANLNFNFAAGNTQGQVQQPSYAQPSYQQPPYPQQSYQQPSSQQSYRPPQSLSTNQPSTSFAGRTGGSSSQEASAAGFAGVQLPPLASNAPTATAPTLPGIRTVAPKGSIPQNSPLRSRGSTRSIYSKANSTWTDAENVLLLKHYDRIPKKGVGTRRFEQISERLKKEDNVEKSAAACSGQWLNHVKDKQRDVLQHPMYKPPPSPPSEIPRSLDKYPKRDGNDKDGPGGGKAGGAPIPAG